MKLPNNETIVVTYVYEDIKCYIATRNVFGNKFTLYKIVEGDYQRLKVADTPVEFDEIIKKDRSK